MLDVGMSFQRSTSTSSSSSGKHHGGSSSSSAAAAAGDAARSPTIGTLKLSDSTISRLQIAKRFNKNTDTVNALCFSDNGELLLTSGEDDEMFLYNTVNVSIFFFLICLLHFN
jgi:WD40 repeat protein